MHFTCKLFSGEQFRLIEPLVGYFYSLTLLSGLLNCRNSDVEDYCMNRLSKLLVQIVAVQCMLISKA